MATSGMMAARQVCRNSTTTSTTSTMASPMVSITASTDCWMNCVGIVDDGVFDAGREPLRQLRHQIGDALGGVERIGARPLKNRQRDRGVMVEIGVRRVVERGELDVGDVAQPHHRAGRFFDDDIAELRRRIEPAERLHRDLKRARMRHRRLIEHAGGDLDVLRLQRIGHVGCGQAERLQAVRIEPDAHRIIAAAEHGDRADAVDAGERIGDFERGVVRNEQGIARLVGRIKMHDHHQVGRGFCHRDADIADVGRQPRLRDGDAVLDLHLGDVEVGAEVERHLDRKAPVRRRIGRHIEHVLDAVDLLLHRRDHRGGDDFGAGAGILPGDVDDRRRDLGILRDRQARERHAAQDHEDDRDHGGKDRPIDEEVRDAHFTASTGVSLAAGLRRRRGSALLLRLHLDAGLRVHQAVDDHAVGGEQAVADDA